MGGRWACRSTRALAVGPPEPSPSAPAPVHRLAPGPPASAPGPLSLGSPARPAPALRRGAAPPAASAAAPAASGRVPPTAMRQAMTAPAAAPATTSARPVLPRVDRAQCRPATRLHRRTRPPRHPRRPWSHAGHRSAARRSRHSAEPGRVPAPRPSACSGVAPARSHHRACRAAPGRIRPATAPSPDAGAACRPGAEARARHG